MSVEAGLAVLAIVIGLVGAARTRAQRALGLVRPAPAKRHRTIIKACCGV